MLNATNICTDGSLLCMYLWLNENSCHFLLKVVDLINTAQLEEKDNKLECLRKVIYHHMHCALSSVSCAVVPEWYTPPVPSCPVCLTERFQTLGKLISRTNLTSTFLNQNQKLNCKLE